MILTWEENLRCVKPHPVARVTSSHNERLDNLKRIFIRPKYCQKERRQAGEIRNTSEPALDAFSSDGSLCKHEEFLEPTDPEERGER